MVIYNRRLSLFIIILAFFSLGATKDVVPRADGEGGIGDSAKNWSYAHIDNVYTEGLGIGTSTPSGLFDVEGGDSFFGTSALDNTSADEDVLVAGNLEVEGYIYADTGFVGDGSNLTGISSGSSEWTDTGSIVHPTESTVDEIVVGGTTEATADIFLGVDGTVMFNKQSNAVDFQIYGDTLPNLFFVDGSADAIHVNGTTGIETVNVHGSAGLVHVATGNDDHAVEIDVDAAGFGDVKAIDIFYDTGAIAAGEDEAAILINTDQSEATGGEIYAIEHLATEGSASVYLGFAGALVNPILQESGAFGDHDYCQFTTSGGGEADCLTDSTTTATDDTYFTADNDYVIIGDAALFSELEFLLATVASGSGIDPLIQYSTGGSGFTTFAPTDGTNGMRNNGIIAWDPADIGSWATNTSGNYEIKITRERNSLTTPPVEDIVQKAATVEYHWDKDGQLLVKEVLLEGSSDDAFQQIITTTNPTADRTIDFPDDNLASGDLMTGDGVSSVAYVAKSAIALSDFNDDLTHTSDTNANTICTGGDKYLNGEGACVTIDSTIYETADAAIVKSDEAETLSANWVNTANPWADNEVANDITLTNLSQVADVVATTAQLTELTDASETTLHSHAGGGGSSEWTVNDTLNLVYPNDISYDIYTNGDVGIGTSAPDGDLHVAGIVYIDTQLGVGTTAPATELDVNGTITSNGLDNDGSAVFNESGADVDFRIESDAIVDALFVDGATGYVGFGNTAPVYEFVVESQDPTLYMQFTTSQWGNTSGDGMNFLSNANGWYFIQREAKPIFFDMASDGGRSMTIKEDGDIGIGTETPSGLLDIEGGDMFIGTASLNNTSASEDLLVTGNVEVERYIYADLGFVGDGSSITGITHTTDTILDLGGAETITGNWVNTANPWAVNEVDPTLYDETETTALIDLMKDNCATITGGASLCDGSDASGGGGTLDVKEAGSVVTSSAGTVDFGAGFDITDSPTGEANIVLDLTEDQVNLTTEVTGVLPDANVADDITIDLATLATNVTTNANLTGHVTSTGNAAILGSFTEAQLETAVSDDNPLFDGDVGSNVQAWDTQLDDLADGTLTGNFVNTANPWGTDEVDSTIYNDTDIDLIEAHMTANCIAITGSADLCDGNDATGGAGSSEWFDNGSLIYPIDVATDLYFTGNLGIGTSVSATAGLWYDNSTEELSIGTASSGTIDFGTNSLSDTTVGNLKKGSIPLWASRAIISGNWSASGAVIDGASTVKFDNVADDRACWSVKVPNDFNDNPVYKTNIASDITETTDTFGLEVAVKCTSAGDSESFYTSAGFDTTNGSGAGVSTSDTAGYLTAVSLSLTNNDTMTAGDNCAVCVIRDVDDTDTASGLMLIPDSEIEYDRD